MDDLHHRKPLATTAARGKAALIRKVGRSLWIKRFQSISFGKSVMVVIV